MALESVSTIDGLVSTNPTSGDPKSQGDDHIRLLKAVLKAEFTPYTHGTAGSIPLPGGLIWKWGSGTSSSAGVATVTFADAFPNNCLRVLAVPIASGAARLVTHTNPSPSGFDFEMWTVGGVRVNGETISWLAIGN